MKSLSFLKCNKNTNIFLRFSLSILVFVFTCFFIYQTARAQSIKLLVQRPDCVRNSDCGQNRYCDIDTHTCVTLPEIPEPACNAELCNLAEICPVTECKTCPEPACTPTLCNLDEICPQPEPTVCLGPSDCANTEYFDFGSHTCLTRPDKCNFLLDGACIECIKSADCANERPYCNPDSHTCESCGDQKIFDASTGQCVCNPSMYETDESGRCVCKTEEKVEQELNMSATWQEEKTSCKVKMADFGKLKGTYYFKRTGGFLIYGTWSQVNVDKFKDLGFQHVTDDFVGKQIAGLSVYVMEGDVDRGLILGIQDTQKDGMTHIAETFEAEVAAAPIKYFTFDGTKDIWLEFRDHPCNDNDNGSTMQLELRRVVDYCEQ